MSNRPDLPAAPPFDDDFVDRLLEIEESSHFEVKRIVGEKLTRALETIVAFANTDGGVLALGIDDIAKSTGRDRVYGVQEHASNVDELERLVTTKVTPRLDAAFLEIGCTLSDGSRGSIVVVYVEKGPDVHSILLGGTWARLHHGNRQMTAGEVTRLRFERGKITAETQLADVPFGLLNTDYWRAYASKRKLTRELPGALEHLGLAKQTAEGELRPTHAAVLLFAEEPGGLLGTKPGVRVFHYKGERIEHNATPNLQKPPVSFSGPILTQINDAYQYILNELATGVQMGPLGFEIIQRYPARVIREAVTNAVIHRDYSLNTDIQVRIFSDRIEVESPGTLPGRVTPRNIREIGSVSRNPLIVSNLREFPDPPNLDAGEGVRMMYQTMDTAGLYPPLYLSRATTGKDEVRVVLRNENRPSAWDQLWAYLNERGSIGNAELRKLLGTDDTLFVSKLLRRLVDAGVLVVANPGAAKQRRRYKLPEQDLLEPLLSRGIGKQRGNGT